MTPDVITAAAGEISKVLSAVGALGTAAFGLVDASKGLGGGISNAGFKSVRKAVEPLINVVRPGPAPAGSATKDAPVFGPADMLATLRANWLNGVAKADQKAIAKSLIRLGISPATAPALAQRTGVGEAELLTVAQNIATGKELTPEQLTVLGQFDAIVSAILDEGYERGDQQYRNSSKLAAGLVAILLAVFGGAVLVKVATVPEFFSFLFSGDGLLAVVVGAISTPLAPVVKDLTSALTTAVKSIGTLKTRSS